MPLFKTLRNALPRSLFTHLGEPARAIEVPARVATLIRAQEEESERLIGWAQLVMAATFAALYLIAPRPLDAGMSMLAPVPLALTGYASFTAARLWLAYRGFLPGWWLVLSMLVDTVLLLGLIWAFHLQYDQPAAFSLKVPTFIYIFAFIALRALRFDHRYVLSAGLFAATGWAACTRALTSAATYELAVAQGYVATCERLPGSSVAGVSEPLDLVVLKS